MMQRNGSVVVSWGILAVVLLALSGCSRPMIEGEEPPVSSAVSPLQPEGAEPVLAESPLEEGTVAAIPAHNGQLAIREIKVISDNGQEGLFIKLSGRPSSVTHLVLEKPTRLVIDIAGPTKQATGAERYIVRHNRLLTDVRAAYSEGKIRITAALRSAVAPPYTVNDLNDTVVAFLGEPTGGNEPLQEQLVYSHRVGAIAGTVDENVPHPPRQERAKTDSGTPAGASRQAEAGTRPVYVGQNVSLDFKDADVHNVLRLLAEVSKLNIVATDDVKGKVTLRLFEIPWDQALDILLQTLNLESIQEGNVVRVSTVKRLREEREERQRAMEAAKILEPLRVDYIKVNYTKAKALADIVSGAARSRPVGIQGTAMSRTTTEDGVLSNRGSVFVDELSNTIIVRDIQRGIDNARDLVRRLDVQTPQVLIESSIIEATTDFARELGVQWGYRYLAGPATGNPTGVNFPGTIGFGGAGLGTSAGGVPFMADFPASQAVTGAGSALNLALGSVDGSQSLDLRLSSFERQGKARIVSRPRVVTLNNVAATIKSLTIIRVRLPSTGTVINTGAGGQAGGQSIATERIETGIVLVVTPQVSSDGFVLLDMATKSSQADFTRTVDQIPTEITREANSHILVRSGQTVVLGGIYRDNFSEQRTGMPYLQDIPIIGWLFRNYKKDDRREDLLVFLTPRVMGVPGSDLPNAEDLWRNRDGSPRG